MTTVAPRRPRKSDARREALWVDVPFTKAPGVEEDGTGDLVLSGYASTWGMDRDDELIAADAFNSSLGAYLSKNPMLLWQHNMDWPIGAVRTATTDETGLYVTAVVPNPGDGAADWQKGAYTSIKNGVVRTFSIGGYFTREARPGPDGPVFYIVEVDLFEISCVSIPANADSIYEAAVKAINGSGPVFAAKAHAQMEQLLAIRELSDPELRAMTPEERQKRFEDLSSLFERAYEIPAPPRDAYLKVVRAREAGVDPAVIHEAATKLHQVLSNPQAAAAEEKAGRAISASNREKLEAALASHDQIAEKMLGAAEMMKEAAGHHDDASAAIKDVLGVTDEETPPDPDEDEREDEAAPAKAAEGDAKQLTYDLFARLREAGVERFGSDDPEERIYVYVDDFDLDEGFVVYCVYGPDRDDYYRVSFTRGEDGSVALSLGQEEVAPMTSYVPKSVKAPLPYERTADETVECPNCNRFNAPDARYCDQCGYQLEGRTDVGGADGARDGEPYEPAAYSRSSDEDVECPSCGRFNDEDASHCDQCGALLEAAESSEGQASASAPGQKDEEPEPEPEKED